MDRLADSGPPQFQARRGAAVDCGHYGSIHKYTKRILFLKRIRAYFNV